MKLSEFHKAIVACGKAADPRSIDDIDDILAARQKAYDKLDETEKVFFDAESIWNPYSDTRVVCGDLDARVKKVIVGIDVDAAELTLVDRLNEKGAAIDLVIAHHPRAQALVTLPDVMDLQSDIFYQQGVSIAASETLLAKRKKQVDRSVRSGNFLRAKHAAELLGLRFMTAHTPADSMGYKYLEDMIAQKKPATMGDLQKMLLDIPEYEYYAKESCAPTIINGSPSSRIKKVHFEFTGGTEGPVEIYDKLSAAGVDTIIAMHQSDKHLEAATKANINVLLAGHMASDVLGLNLLFDKLEEKAEFEIVSFSGFFRIKR